MGITSFSDRSPTLDREETSGGEGVPTVRAALIAGVVAAIVAAASSTAATIVITSKQIKDGSIQAVDLSAGAKRALKGARGAPGARGAQGSQGPAGIQGPQGIQGPPGAPGIQRLRLVTSGSVTITPGTQGQAEAACPAGETAVSGGYGLDSTDAAVFNSFGNGSGWVAEAENPTGTGVPTAHLTAYAYCAPSMTFVP